MRDDEPSHTAAWVAAARAVAPLLPPTARLVDDPFGARFGGPRIAALREAAERHPRVAAGVGPAVLAPFLSLVLWMQIRTRVLDDALRAFARGGGRQIVLLGAGYDCRAYRLAADLTGAVVFEVDHPATQSRKRAIVGAESGGLPVHYLAWNFERLSMDDLPAALAAIGHRAAEPTITVWEGVTMYLTPAAIDATVRAVAAYSSPGSLLALTYREAGAGRRHLQGRVHHHFLERVLRRAGEPFRFGWDPAELPVWMRARGFALTSDRAESDLARELLPSRWALLCRESPRHVAIAKRGKG